MLHRRFLYAVGARQGVPKEPHVRWEEGKEDEAEDVDFLAESAFADACLHRRSRNHQKNRLRHCNLAENVI